MRKVETTIYVMTIDEVNEKLNQNNIPSQKRRDLLIAVTDISCARNNPSTLHRLSEQTSNYITQAMIGLIEDADIEEQLYALYIDEIIDYYKEIYS